MGNPVQTIPNLPPAISLSGAEQVWINQAGVDRRASVAQLGGGASPVSGGTVSSYAEMRASTLSPEAAVVLNDPHKGGIFVAADPSLPLRDNGGTVIFDASGQPWQRVYDGPVNAAWFYSGPGYLGDAKTTAITAADQVANPQWIGLPAALGGGPYPVGTTWASVALQEALYACFAGTSTPGNVVWNWNTTTGNLPFRVPPGYMRINIPFYLMATGLDLTFSEKRAAGLIWIGPKTQSPVMFDAISYGAIRNLSVIDQAGVADLPLVDVNWTGANPGLKTQQLTFYDWYIGGSGTAGLVGVEISRSGGNAQGDTVCLVNPIIGGCNSGVIAGGDNALSIITLQGNVQSAVKNGYMTLGGSFFLYGPSFQAAAVDFHVYPQASQITMDGADAYAYPGGGASSRCELSDIRSENIVLSLDRNNASRLNSCGIVQNGMYGWGAGGHQHIGMLASTPGLINNFVICVDDGGPAWFAADASSTNTRIVKAGPSPGWAVNQWAGYARWFRYGNGFSFAGTLTASDANSITDPTGFYQPEPFPGFQPGMLAGYLVKIVGVSGAVQPNWDSFPPGQATPPYQPFYGFTTGAGSNVVSTGSVVANGNYVVVCDVVRVQAPSAGALLPGAMIGKVQNLTPGASFTGALAAGGVLTVSAMTSGTIKIGAALIGWGGWQGTVVVSQTSGTPGGAGVYQVSNPTQPPVASGAISTQPSFEVVSSFGEPILATRAVLDALGYWGAGIPDGQVTWLPVDFDMIAGAVAIDNVTSSVYGKFRNIGIANFAGDFSATPLARIRPNPPLFNFGYRNSGAVTQALVASQATVNPLNIDTAQVSSQAHAVFSNLLAALTLNMPIWLANVLQDFRVEIVNQSAGAVLTWGANIKAAAPTVNLGAAGKVTIVTLTWIGDANQTWFVTNVQGPM